MSTLRDPTPARVCRFPSTLRATERQGVPDAHGPHRPERTKPPPTMPRLRAWVEEVAALTQPDEIHWCDGSAEEYDQLAQALIDAGTFERLSEAKRPNSYLALSDPADVARVEDRTFICSERRVRRRADQPLARSRPRCARCSSELFKGSMRGRTMYVVPFSMGPLGSPISYIGVQLTDSRLRGGLDADHDPDGAGRARRARRGRRVRALPALGRACRWIRRRTQDVPWPCNADNKYIVHFPETREIWSFGSGYGGNALLGKKCFALRIASVMARDEGWLAEHMLILKLTSPEGEVKYIAGAFPSACGKTNLAMMIPTLAGLEGRDDRRRHRLDEVRRGRPAVRGQSRGRASSASPRAPARRTNPNAIDMVGRNTIFTNCAKTDDGDIWWEGLTGEPPAHAIDWRGNDWTPDSETPAAHPNARFTVPAAQCPSIAPEWEDPEGVPIVAILFGGRRADRRAAGARGPRLGARRLPGLDHVLGDDRRAGRRGRQAALRPDGDAAVLRLQHGRLLRPLAADRAPRRGASCRGSSTSTGSARTRTASSCGPGFGENSRVLAWIFRRCEGDAEASRDADRAACRPSARAASTPTGWTSPQRDDGEAARGRPRRLGGSSCRRCRALRRVRRQAAGRAARPARRARAAPRAAERPYARGSPWRSRSSPPTPRCWPCRPASSRRRERRPRLPLAGRAAGPGWALVPIGVDRRA